MSTMNQKCPQGRFGPTYHTNALAKKRSSGQHIQDMDATLEGFHRPAVISAEFVGAWCLPLEHSSYRLDRIASFELVGKRVFGEFCPGLLFVIAQSGLEEGLEMRGRSRGEAHAVSSGHQSARWGWKKRSLVHCHPALMLYL